MAASTRHTQTTRRRIAEAIAAHRLLQLDYKGCTRVVEPHIYGIDTQGHEALSAYQVAGGSLSGEYAGWKTFDIAHVAGIKVLKSHFPEPRREYNPAHALFRTVYEQL